MKMSFFKRQGAWVCLLVIGLAIVCVCAFHPKSRFNIENYLPMLNCSAENDTSTFVLTGYNFGFETVTYPTGLPDGWNRWGSLSYACKLDSVEKHSGKYSIRIESRSKEIATEGFGCPFFAIPAKYAGKTVTVKAFMKLEDVEIPIGLLLRIDDNKGNIVAFDNMQQREITGTCDWREYSVTVDLPPNAKTIYIGAIHSGKGKLWVDDFQVLIGR